MEDKVIKLEHEMWQAALNKNTEEFKKLVSPDAVMICGGYRCLGKEYASFIADFNISEYNISNMEVINSSDCEVILHYTISIKAKDIDAQDLAGPFHIVSVWKKNNEAWSLIFNMDSRIIEG